MGGLQRTCCTASLLPLARSAKPWAMARPSLRVAEQLPVLPPRCTATASLPAWLVPGLPEPAGAPGAEVCAVLPRPLSRLSRRSQPAPGARALPREVFRGGEALSRSHIWLVRVQCSSTTSAHTLPGLSKWQREVTASSWAGSELGSLGGSWGTRKDPGPTPASGGLGGRLPLGPVEWLAEVSCDASQKAPELLAWLAGSEAR